MSRKRSSSIRSPCTYADLAQDAEHAHDAHEAEDDEAGEGVGGEDAREDEQGVEQVPGGPDEGLAPVGDGVGGDVGDEDGEEEGVESVDQAPRGRARAVLPVEVVDELRLDDVDCKVLCGGGRERRAEGGPTPAAKIMCEYGRRNPLKRTAMIIKARKYWVVFSTYALLT